MKKDRGRTRKRQIRQHPSGRNLPNKTTRPALSVVDSHAEHKEIAQLELARLAPMAAVGMALMTLLTVGFLIAEQSGVIPITLSYDAGIEAFALRALILGGLFPVVTASLLIAIYRPAADFILGRTPDLASCVLAPVTGFLFGWLVWGIGQLATSLVGTAAEWIAMPKMWQVSGLYLGRSPLYSVLIVIIAVVVPATSGELLYRGILLPSYQGRDGHVLSGFFPALFFASTMLDVPGMVVFVTAALMASWIRIATDSLIASALSTAGFAIAMLYARPLFSMISQAIFKMPLIDNIRVRVFLVTLCLILLVLLLVPTALINGIGRRTLNQYQGMRKNKVRGPFAKINAITAVICIAVLLALHFLFK